MNILMFCSNPVNGGTAKVFYELVTYFQRNKVDEDKIFACVNKDNPAEIYRKISFLDRVDVYSEEELFKGLYGGNCLARLINKIVRKVKYASIKKKNIDTMKNYLKDNKIDCVLIHNGGYVGDDLCNQMLEAAYDCANQIKARIYVLHNDFKKNVFSKIRFKNYDKFISNAATELITVSNYTRNRLLASSYISQDIQVVYNGLSESNALSEEEKKKRIKLKAEKQNVLMLGNFQENKGQIKFIDVARIIATSKSDVEFTFIGNVCDESYYDECQRRINSYGLKGVITILHGINNAAEYIDLFDVVVVPSMYDESFGLISVEAMAKSTPVVAFACGGIPEVVADGITGYIVPVGDSKAMADRVLTILNNTDLCDQLGENGRKEYINYFSVEAMAKRYYQIVEVYRKHKIKVEGNI